MVNIWIAIALLLAWLVAVLAGTGKLPASLSQSVFLLPPWGRVLWTLVIGAVTFLTVPTLIDKCSEQTQFLAFIACAGLAFVAAVPLVSDKGDQAYAVHMAGAYTCAIASQIILITNGAWWMLTGWIPWIVCYCIPRQLSPYRWQTKVLWAEITCFALTFLFILG